MNLSNLITNVQTTLQDAGVHFTNSAVSVTLNDAQRIVGLTTLCYEKSSDDWSPTIVAYQQFMPMPSDCIVPIYVRDATSRNRVYPAKLNDLELSDTSWWGTTGTYYQYYSIFNPSFADDTTSGYCMLVYPRINTTSFRLHMVYAAVPSDMVSGTSTTKLPKGEESILSDYGKFIGLIRQHGRTERAVEFLQKFMAGIGRINDLMKSRYPGGRDFEPEPIEHLLKRSDDDFVIRRREQSAKRTNTRRRGR